MLKTFDARLNELREKYTETDDREFYFRFLEAQSLREKFVNEQSRGRSNPRQSERRTED